MGRLSVLVIPGLVSFLCFTAVFAAKQRSAYFQRRKEIDRKVLVHGLLKELKTKSKLDCMSWSYNYKYCNYVFYNRDTELCRLYDHTSNSGLQDSGSGWQCWHEIQYRVKLILSTETRTWKQATKACSKLNGSLAVIDSRRMYDKAEKLIRGRGMRDYVWLGATDADKEGHWLWVDSQEMTFNMWAPFKDQPNNFYNQDCLAVIYKNDQYWGWFDNNCSSRAYYLCEIDIQIKL